MYTTFFHICAPLKVPVKATQRCSSFVGLGPRTFLIGMPPFAGPIGRPDLAPTPQGTLLAATTHTLPAPGASGKYSTPKLLPHTELSVLNARMDLLSVRGGSILVAARASAVAITYRPGGGGAAVACTRINPAATVTTKICTSCVGNLQLMRTSIL